MRKAAFVATSCVLFAASLPLHGEAPAVSAGKERAARSALDWEVRDIDHALLGPIRVAVQKSSVTTTVGSEKILSQVFVSCQKGSGKIAIELANAPGSDPAGGLRPMEMPRLVCSSPGTGGTREPVQRDIAARWEVSALGDTLARDLSPPELRRCASIEVRQSIALPPGSSTGSQRIAIEITPYGKALDTVFTACGEATAYPTGERAAPAAPTAGAPWKPARTTTKGRTNLRTAPSTDSPIARKLDAGTRIVARPASSQWWEVRPRSGEGFRGYIREDRLVFD